MATFTVKGETLNTTGELPAVGAAAPAFQLTRNTFEDVGLDAFGTNKKVLNVFFSIETPVCQASVRTFNKEAASLGGVSVLNISADLPFSLKSFCGADGLEDVETLSTFRSSFAKDYGLQIAEGPLRGLCSRCVLVLDADNKVLHREQVPELGSEPDYAAALAAL